MRIFIAIVVSAAALMAADPQAKKSEPKVRDGSKPIPIPAGATQSADGDYHYTDPQGKKWIYRKTPFGVAKLEDKPEDQQGKPTAAQAAAGIKATEAGDVVKFERQGPFGVWKWEKKKSELDDTEKAALENARAARESKQE